MHIAAYMAACDIADVDRNAKDALRALCARASHPGGIADVSVRRIAADMKVHRNTASRALRRLVDAGYISVEKRPGDKSRWRLGLHLLGVQVVAPPGSAGVAPPGSATKDVLDKTRISGAPPKNQQSAFAPGSGHLPDFTGSASPSPTSTGRTATPDQLAAATSPSAIAACPYCDDHGWLWVGNTILGRCSHQRPVSDLTVADVLNNGSACHE